MGNITGINKDIAPNFIFQLPKDEISIGDLEDKSLILNFEGGNISSGTGCILQIWDGGLTGIRLGNLAEKICFFS